MSDPSSPSDRADTIDPTRLDIVSRVEGVRPCVHCGHDLHGQPIRREDSLGVLVAFCPECGRAASLVEHPTLGVWGRRLGVFFAACMIAVVILVLVATVMSLFGIMMGLSSEAISDSRAVLSEMVEKDVPGSGGWQIERSWWEANAGEARRAMWWSVDFRDDDFLLIGMLFLPICFLMGVIWSGILLGLRRRHLPLAGAVICLLSWSIMEIGMLVRTRAGVNAFPTSTYRLVEQELLPTVGTFVMSGLSIPFILGLLFGRPILRSLVKAVLPPRSRGILRPLWDIDKVTLRIPGD